MMHSTQLSSTSTQHAVSSSSSPWDTSIANAEHTSLPQWWKPSDGLLSLAKRGQAVAISSFQKKWQFLPTCSPLPSFSSASSTATPTRPLLSFFTRRLPAILASSTAADSVFFPAASFLLGSYTFSLLYRVYTEDAYRLERLLCEVRSANIHLQKVVRMHLVVIGASDDSDDDEDEEEEEKEAEGSLANEGGDNHTNDGNGTSASEAVADNMTLSLRSPPLLPRYSHYCIPMFTLKPIHKSIAIAPPTQIEIQQQQQQQCRRQSSPSSTNLHQRGDVKGIPSSTFMAYTFAHTLHNPHLLSEKKSDTAKNRRGVWGKGVQSHPTTNIPTIYDGSRAAKEFMDSVLSVAFSHYLSLVRCGAWRDHTLRPLMVDVWSILVSGLNELLRTAVLAAAVEGRGGDDEDEDDYDSGGSDSESEGGGKGSAMRHTRQKRSQSSSYSPSPLVTVPPHIIERALAMCAVLLSPLNSLWSFSGAKETFGRALGLERMLDLVGEGGGDAADGIVCGALQTTTANENNSNASDGSGRGMGKGRHHHVESGGSRARGVSGSNNYVMLAPVIAAYFVDKAGALLDPSLASLFVMRRRKSNKGTEGNGAKGRTSSAFFFSFHSLPTIPLPSRKALKRFIHHKVRYYATVLSAWRVMVTFVSWKPLLLWLGFAVGAAASALTERIFATFIESRFGGGGGGEDFLGLSASGGGEPFGGSDAELLRTCEGFVQRAIGGSVDISAAAPSFPSLSSASSSSPSSASSSTSASALVGRTSLVCLLSLVSTATYLIGIVCTDMESYNEEIVRARLCRSAEVRTALLCCVQNTHTIVGDGEGDADDDFVVGGGSGSYVSQQFQKLGQLESIMSVIVHSVWSTVRLAQVVLIATEGPVGTLFAASMTYVVSRTVFAAKRNLIRAKVARHWFHSSSIDAEAVTEALLSRCFTNAVVLGAGGATSAERERERERGGGGGTGSMLPFLEFERDPSSDSSHIAANNLNTPPSPSHASSSSSSLPLHPTSLCAPSDLSSLLVSPFLSLKLLQQRVHSMMDHGGGSGGMVSAAAARQKREQMGPGGGGFAFMMASDPCSVGAAGDAYWNTLFCGFKRGGGGGAASQSAIGKGEHRACFGLGLLIAVACENKMEKRVDGRDSTTLSSLATATPPPSPDAHYFLTHCVASYLPLWLPLASFFMVRGPPPRSDAEAANALRCTVWWCDLIRTGVLECLLLTAATEGKNKRPGTENRSVSPRREGTTQRVSVPLHVHAHYRGVFAIGAKARMLLDTVNYTTATTTEKEEEEKAPADGPQSTSTLIDGLLSQDSGSSAAKALPSHCRRDAADNDCCDGNAVDGNTLGWPSHIWELHGKDVHKKKKAPLLSPPSSPPPPSSSPSTPNASAPPATTDATAVAVAVSSNAESINFSSPIEAENYASLDDPALVDAPMLLPTCLLNHAGGGGGGTVAASGASANSSYFMSCLRMSGLEKAFAAAAGFVDACESVTLVGGVGGGRQGGRRRGKDGEKTPTALSIIAGVAVDGVRGIVSSSTASSTPAAVGMGIDALLFDRIPQQKASLVEAAAGFGFELDALVSKGSKPIESVQQDTTIDKNESRNDDGDSSIDTQQHALKRKQRAILSATTAGSAIGAQLLSGAGGILFSEHDTFTSVAEDLLPKRVYDHNGAWQTVADLGELLMKRRDEDEEPPVDEVGDEDSNEREEDELSPPSQQPSPLCPSAHRHVPAPVAISAHPQPQRPLPQCTAATTNARRTHALIASYRRLLDCHHLLPRAERERGMALLRSWLSPQQQNQQIGHSGRNNHQNEKATPSPIGRSFVSSNGHGIGGGGVEIIFDNVSFSYPSMPYAKVLNNVSFTIPSGAFVGVVGPSGGGKSTLLALMMGLYAPTEGRILFNGVDICSGGGGVWGREGGGGDDDDDHHKHQQHQSRQHIPLRALRRRVAYVGSECDLLPCSIGANILLGDALSMLRQERSAHIATAPPTPTGATNATGDDNAPNSSNSISIGERRGDIVSDRIMSALKDAQADGFVLRTSSGGGGSGGLHTRVGGHHYGMSSPSSSSSSPFSGGEVQRLSIARAFVKKREETLLYILDEATSALDAETEHAVHQRFMQSVVGSREGEEDEEEGKGKEETAEMERINEVKPLSSSSSSQSHSSSPSSSPSPLPPRCASTCVVAAHRLSTIRQASLILVIADGKLLEKGTWDELLAKKGSDSEGNEGGGLFAQFVAAQKL